MTTITPRLDLSPESSLLLLKIGEPSNNDLSVIVIEAKPGTGVIETELGPANPIEADATSRAFEFIWWNYVAYSVRNESYWQQEAGHPPEAALTGVKTASAFLVYVSATTFATDDYPGRLMHWFLNTEWHCIDVVSNTAPEVRELSPAEILRVQMAAPIGQRPS
ncbi:hypothetical protein ACFPIF_18755 [Brevundimonas faecalis]|uniref:hypothetical protein n=1 Tax=Brevundimonas faecalis TaxID=947378 RepID=UPI00361E3711